MQVLGCKSVALARIRLTITHIGTPEKGGIVAVEEHAEGKRTIIWIPKSVAARLAIGNIIEALCVPSPDLTLGLETFALAVKSGNITEQIYARSAFWQDEFSSLIF